MFTVMVYDTLAPLSVHVICTCVLAVTMNVVIVKVAFVMPAGTVTVAGAVATAVFAEVIVMV
jgi:hypothetical protein